MNLQGRQPTNGSGDWREKFLAKVDELEHSEEQSQQLQSLLKSGLIRLSLAADGLDLTLDKELDELRHMLKSDTSTFRLQQHFEQLKHSILALDTKKQQRVQQCVTALHSLSSQLQAICANKPQLKELDFFIRQLKQRAQDEMHYSQLIDDFSALQKQILLSFNPQTSQATPHKESPQKSRSLFQSLFHAKHSTEKTASTEPTAKRDTDNKPAQTSSFDLDELMEEVFDGDKLQQQQLESHSHNPEPSPLGKPKSFNDSAIRFQRQKYQQGENVSFENIAEHIASILNDLFQQLEAQGPALDYIHSAEAQLNQGLNCLRLIPTLEDTSHAVISWQGQSREEFSNYLNNLNDSLELIQKSLYQAAQSNSESTTSLDNTFSQQIILMQEEVEAASDLQSLKDAVQDKTQLLLAGIKQFKTQNMHSENSLCSQLSTLQQRITVMEQEAQTTQVELQQQRQQALTDALTQLPNRAAFDERLQLELNRWQRYQSPLCVLIADIDLFKRVNDSWGHHAGDKVLQVIAKHMQQRLRETDFIARFGGEEFIVLLTDTTLADGQKIAEQLRETVHGCPFHFKDSHVKITISAGLATFHQDDDFNQVFQRADEALYKAKNAGRNRVCTELDLPQDEENKEDKELKN